MQHGSRTAEVSPAEWRWVLVVGGLLATITLLPYAWALAVNANATDWQFMGILVNPQDGATYLAKIGQGMRGSWLVQLMHTPDPHPGAAIYALYPLLGYLAKLIGVSNIFIFHLARVAATLFMFTSLYQLGASIWMRVRPRRLFFGLVSVGSGLGWLFVLLSSTAADVPDLNVPEAYPLYAAYTNPHFPLIIGCLALIAATYVTAFRIDFPEEPSVGNGGLTVFVLTLIAALVLPQALIPFGATLVMYVVILAVKQRRLPVRELRWAAMYFLPAGLMAVYYYLVIFYNPIIGRWNQQIATTSPSLLLVLLAYGVLLLVALPGLSRALRRFESDGDRLMLIWFAVNFVLIFLPFNHQRRFMTGLIIPITFFAVRSLEDYWLPRIPEGRRRLAMILLFLLVIPSHILSMGVPLFGLFNPAAGLDLRLLVEHDYWDMMNWFAEQPDTNQVILSSPNIGLWIPAYGAKRVVYGHPWETLDGERRKQLVEDWYTGEDCYWPSLETDGFAIDYVVVGPQERALSAREGASDSCYADLAARSSNVVEIGEIAIYEMDTGD